MQEVLLIYLFVHNKFFHCSQQIILFLDSQQRAKIGEHTKHVPAYEYQGRYLDVCTSQQPRKLHLPSQKFSQARGEPVIGEGHNLFTAGLPTVLN